jgi:glycosyltransferase involved in cell wall biosynthesis
VNITFISGFYLEIGGPFSVLKDLLNALCNKKNIKVVILSPIPEKYKKKKLEFIENLPFPVRFVEQGVFSCFIPSYSKRWSEIILNAEKNSDIFHINGIFDYYSIIASFFLKCPYILSPCGSLMKEAYELSKLKKLKKIIFMKLFGARIVNNATLIQVMCQKESDDFLFFFPRLKKKVRIIPNPVDLSEFQNALSKEEFVNKYPRLKNKRYILFLGRLHRIKGLDLLIKAFSEIVKEKDLQLVLAGPDTYGYGKQLKKWVEDFSLEDRVVFTGMISGNDRVSALHNAEIFVLSSYSENFGMAIVEAMACGTPVVITDKVGIANEIKENNAGVIVEANPESIYKGIKTLLDNENLRKKISVNGKKMVEKYYDVNKIAGKMIGMYKEVLKK